MTHNWCTHHFNVEFLGILLATAWRVKFLSQYSTSFTWITLYSVQLWEKKVSFTSNQQSASLCSSAAFSVWSAASGWASSLSINKCFRRLHLMTLLSKSLSRSCLTARIAVKFLWRSKDRTEHFAQLLRIFVITHKIQHAFGGTNSSACPIIVRPRLTFLVGTENLVIPQRAGLCS